MILALCILSTFLIAIHPVPDKRYIRPQETLCAVAALTISITTIWVMYARLP